MPDMTPDEERRVNEIVDARLAESETRQKQAMDEGFERVCTLIRSGFPDGDPAEHRKAHEQMIAAHRERADFYRDLRKQLAGKGVLALVGVLLIALWHYAGDMIRRGGA